MRWGRNISLDVATESRTHVNGINVHGAITVGEV